LQKTCQLTSTDWFQVVQILEKGTKLPFEVVAESLELPELQGEPEDIAKEKCRLAAQKVDGPVMVEDTSAGWF